MIIITVMIIYISEKLEMGIIPSFLEQKTKVLEKSVAFPGSEFQGVSRHKFDESQSNKSTLTFHGNVLSDILQTIHRIQVCAERFSLVAFKCSLNISV